MHELSRQIAESSQRQGAILLQSKATLDANCLRDACTAILMTANQLLERSQGLTTSSKLQHSNQVTAHPAKAFPYGVDHNLSGSACMENSFQETSILPSSSTQHSEVDTPSMDFSNWVDSGKKALRLSDGTDGCYDILNPPQSSVCHAFDMGVWSALDNDKWPCFPG